LSCPSTRPGQPSDSSVLLDATETKIVLLSRGVLRTSDQSSVAWAARRCWRVGAGNGIARGAGWAIRWGWRATAGSGCASSATRTGTAGTGVAYAISGSATLTMTENEITMLKIKRIFSTIGGGQERLKRMSGEIDRAESCVNRKIFLQLTGALTLSWICS